MWTRFATPLPRPTNPIHERDVEFKIEENVNVRGRRKEEEEENKNGMAIVALCNTIYV